MTPSAPHRALLIGNSDGIGRATTGRLLASGWTATGVSRSPLATGGDYTHHLCDVTSPDYPALLTELWEARGPFDLVVHCVGIGPGLEGDDFVGEAHTVTANFTSLVQTVEAVLPRMLARGAGHLIGLSSLADVLAIHDAPSYSSSKAGYSSYLRSLHTLLRRRPVDVTNVRFGFVDTKMAQAPVRPLMISAERAADVLMRCVRRRPAQVSYPRTAAVAASVAGWAQRAWSALR